MNLKLTKIKWDAKPKKHLPKSVIVTDAPDDWENEEYMERLENFLSDQFGFCHFGFEVVELDVPVFSVEQ